MYQGFKSPCFSKFFFAKLNDSIVMNVKLIKGVVPPILISRSLVAHILNNTLLSTGMKTDKYFTRYLQPMARIFVACEILERVEII